MTRQIYQPFVATANMLGVTAPDLEGHLRVQRIDGPNRSARVGNTVVFRFDDGYDSFENAVDVADGKGVPVCNALISGKMGEYGRLTYAQCLEFQANGHGFMNHSATHYYGGDFDIRDLLDPDSEYYDLDLALAEVKGSYDTLKINGIDAPIYVNPGHATDWRTQEFIRKYQRAAMSAAADPYFSQRNVNTYKINGYPSDTLFTGGDDGTIASAIEGLIDDMQAMYEADNGDGRLLVIYGHDCTEGAGATALAAVIDYIQANDSFEILTADDALDKHAPTFESGNLADEGRGFSVSPDGTVRGNEGHFTNQVLAFDPSDPFKYSVGFKYLDADLVLFPYNSDTDYVRVDALGLTPLSDNETSLGRTGYSFKELWHRESRNYSNYGNKSLCDTNIQSATNAGTAATRVMNFTIPEGSQILGFAVRNGGEIGGADSYNIDMSGGLTWAIGASVACTNALRTGVLFDPNSASPITTTGTCTITYTANGSNFDGGTFYTTIYYRALKDN